MYQSQINCQKDFNWFRFDHFRSASYVEELVRMIFVFHCCYGFYCGSIAIDFYSQSGSGGFWS